MNTRNPAQRKYLARLVPLMVVYVGVILAVSFWFRGHPQPGPLGYVLSVLPGLPVVGVIWAMGRYLIEEQDEYLRHQQVRGILWATGFTLVVCTIWGFLQTYGMVPTIELFWVFVLFCAGLGVAKCFDSLSGRPA